MSYDLEIATHHKPERADIDEVLPAGVTSSGVFGGDGNLLVRGRRWSLEIDGPFRCEPEDLAQVLAHAVAAPVWLMQMHVPIGDPKAARDSAARIAAHVARIRLGAVYDPQLGRIIFPRGGKRLTLERITNPLMRTLRCEWCYAPRVLAGQAEEFLSVADSFLPEVIPVRFGTFEPLQHRLAEGQRNFVELWERESGSSGGFFWTCKKPGLGGGVSWPFDNEANAKRGGVPAADLHVELEGDGLTADVRWQAAVIAFFRALSSRTEAVFGRAMLSPPTPARLTANEIYRFMVPAGVFRGRWHGVPRHAAWLTWLGQEYSACFARGPEPAPSNAAVTGHLIVQAENLDADSTRLPEGLSESLYRVSLDGKPVGPTEKLAGDTAFDDATFLPWRPPSLP